MSRSNDTANWKDKWKSTNLFHRVVYFLYIPFLLVGLWLAACLLWLPWTCGLWKPQRRDTPTYDKRGQVTSKRGKRDIFAPLGTTAEDQHGPTHAYIWRTWEMYRLMRECWRTLHRQGLQVVGVLCGLTIGLYQVELLIHDFTDGAVSIDRCSGCMSHSPGLSGTDTWTQ